MTNDRLNNDKWQIEQWQTTMAIRKVSTYQLSKGQPIQVIRRQMTPPRTDFLLLPTQSPLSFFFFLLFFLMLLPSLVPPFLSCFLAPFLPYLLPCSGCLLAWLLACLFAFLVACLLPSFPIGSLLCFQLDLMLQSRLSFLPTAFFLSFQIGLVFFLFWRFSSEVFFHFPRSVWLVTPVERERERERKKGEIWWFRQIL